MVIGDSNAFRPAGNDACWPALLEKKNPQHLKVFNESCDGRTACHDIGDHNALTIIGNKLKIHLPLDYVIVMLGTNDVKTKYGLPGTSDIGDGMRQVIEYIELNGGGAKPIILTPPPMGNVMSGDLAGGQSKIPHVAAEYCSLAMNRDVQLVDIHEILDTSTDLESDMIHLNALGRQKVADAIWAGLKNVTPPPQVDRFLGVRSGSKLILTWSAVCSDIFCYRVWMNGKIFGRTTKTNFEIAAPTIGDNFTGEAVDFFQNTRKASVMVTYNKKVYSTVNAPSINLG